MSEKKEQLQLEAEHRKQAEEFIDGCILKLGSNTAYAEKRGQLVSILSQLEKNQITADYARTKANEIMVLIGLSK